RAASRAAGRCALGRGGHAAGRRRRLPRARRRGRGGAAGGERGAGRLPGDDALALPRGVAGHAGRPLIQPRAALRRGGATGAGQAPVVRRLLLVRHAPTDAVRRVAFPCDEALDDRGRTEAEALGAWLGDVDEAWTSAAARARQTAAAAGLEATVEPALDECDFGRWRGRTLRELHEEDPA